MPAASGTATPGAMFEVLAQISTAAVLLVQGDALVYANPAAEAVTGYDRATLLSLPFGSLIHPDYRERLLMLMRVPCCSEGTESRYQFRIIPPGGDPRWVDFCSVSIHINGEPANLAVFTDITDHRRRAKTLLDMEQRYADIFENSPEGIYQCAAGGRLLRANPALARLLGDSSPDAAVERIENVGRQVFGDPARHVELLSQLGDCGSVRGFEAEFLRRDGRRIDVWLSANAVFDEAAALFSYNAFVRDVTDQKVLEKRLAQAQKMEAIGRLAGGIAHDFNNILTVLMGYSESLLAALPEGGECHLVAQEIKSGARRAALLTRQLLAFSRQQVLKPVILDVTLVLRGMKEMLARLIGEDVELRAQPGPSGQWVKADPQHLEQIVMNLVVNARDAMPGGGVITVASRFHETKVEVDAGPLAPRPGSFVELSVTDTGVGMSAEVLSRIFEPFFTTKPPGQGTGLGLSTVYGIVEQSSGFITVESEPGRGSSFHVSLPYEAFPKLAVEPTELSVLEGAGQSILVVEDDSVVRSVAVRILRSARYIVFEAEDGQQGQVCVEKNMGKVDLILSDVIMPRRGGRDMAAAIATSYPLIPVIFMSGYLSHEAPEVGKPFTREELLRAVEGALARAGKSPSINRTLALP